MTDWVPAVGEEIMISPAASRYMPLISDRMEIYRGRVCIVSKVDVYENPPSSNRRFDVYVGEIGLWWPSCAVMPVSPISVRSENDLDDLLGLVPGKE